MSNVRDALLRMCRVAKEAKRYEKAFDPYETPFTDIYVEAADAIYHLVGEKTELFTDSVTHLVLSTGSLEEGRAADILMDAYEKNLRKGPCITERDEVQKLFKKNGGYMTQTEVREMCEICGRATPEGEWT